MKEKIEKKDIIDEAYEKAVEVLKGVATPNGFFASGGKDGYNAIWARDSMITSLGASLIDDDLMKKTFLKSLQVLGRSQSKNGQIPNAVDIFSNRKPHIDFQSIDSSLWYIIGHMIYKKRYKDSTTMTYYNSSIEKAMNWLSCQDSGEIGMLVQQPTSDWQDAFPHKYGHVINTQALYYAVLNYMGKKRDAKKLYYMVNRDSDKKLWVKEYYAAYRWKNHNQYQEISNWFDTLGNLFAIVFDLADKKRANKILNYIEKNKINKPYPVKTIYPPFTPKNNQWYDYFNDCDARDAYHYSNGAIWGFNGGFYILALVKMKMYKKALEELKKLAEVNLKGNFPEWTNPKTNEAHGHSQAWEAGMYILAYESVKRKKVLL